MAFLEKADLSNVIRQYQLDAITDGQDEIIDTAIETAIDEITNIFTPNDKNEWKDGRPIYDIALAFSKTGADRNSFLLAQTKVVTLWQLVLLCNTGMAYDEVQDRYDRSVKTLKEIASGIQNSATLPKVDVVPPDDDTPWRSGSRTKFNHE